MTDQEQAVRRICLARLEISFKCGESAVTFGCSLLRYGLWTRMD